ncbi:Hpt domain-containing protein [Mucilaginibacter terrae]|uniref:HPt (Histidine-containing phosphotransfer) domain-containing protein n=1 Tax=Mucilaginibacter terrae TaxID=1955052 RepID=A0ABU3GZ59_9SPHI|nr:Hpt domain-containing protein [Mucilaginibacter terrae]MDT3405054.1 HPt (histidine-containing phosphotransfer) domain-containing protein [Mucilaginibacter terrae]
MAENQTDLDLSFLYEIADGSDEFIVESIDMFLQQTPMLISEIGEAIAAQNWNTAGAAAHKLKPNLGFFGMHTTQGMMQDIEHMAKNGAPDASALKEKYETAKELIEANLLDLEKIRAEKSA